MKRRRFIQTIAAAPAVAVPASIEPLAQSPAGASRPQEEAPKLEFASLDAAAETPWALLEALAAGVPAVASDVPALRAVVDGRVPSCLAPVGSRAEVARATDGLIARLDEVLRQAAAAAPAVQQRWSLESSLAGYRQLYGEAVAARRQ